MSYDDKSSNFIHGTINNSFVAFQRHIKYQLGAYNKSCKIVPFARLILMTLILLAAGAAPASRNWDGQEVKLIPRRYN